LAAWIVGGIRCEFGAIPAAWFFGVIQEWVSERYRVPLFDRERALLDAFYHVDVFGSLSVALELLEAHLTAIEVSRPVAYAGQLGVAAVVGRAGWALEQFGGEADVLESLRRQVGTGDSPPDPTLPARGRQHPVWRVIENLSCPMGQAPRCARCGCTSRRQHAVGKPQFVVENGCALRSLLARLPVRNRGWLRNRPRDLYHCWHVSRWNAPALAGHDMARILPAKAAASGFALSAPWRNWL
jgi:hypothetical protein